MKYFFFAAGAVISSLAIFSVQFGLDNDAGWGPKRIALLVAGISCLILGSVIHFFGKAATRVAESFHAFIAAKLSRTARIMAASIASGVIVISAYFWFSQLDQRIVGSDFEYYIEMAKSFKKGHLYLEVTPPPELLALENPYDYLLRREKGVDNFPWDLSLYKDKFYIYWGPAPSVLAALLSRDLLNRMGDFHLALAAASGLFIYQSMIISTYWRRSLNYAPAWLLGVLLIVVGLMTPTPMMLKGAKIYDAAIFSCQFFLIGGCYWAYSAFLDESPSAWKLLLASVHWGLSAGSRIIVLPGMLLCAAITLLFVFQANRRSGTPMVMPFLALAIPILLAGGGLAWYNWARFDSIFEFGLTYQLANIDYTSFTNVFSHSRILTNAYSYLTYPLHIMPRFPYLALVENINFNERLGGLIYIAPYILLLALPALRVFDHLRPVNNDIGKPISERWLFLALLFSGLASLVMIFSFYYISMRYTEDFLPALLTLITIQAGMQYDSFGSRPISRRIFTSTTVVLGAITVIANTLLAIPPDGIKFAINFLNDIYKLLGLK